MNIKLKKQTLHDLRNALKDIKYTEVNEDENLFEELFNIWYKNNYLF